MTPFSSSLKSGEEDGREEEEEEDEEEEEEEGEGEGEGGEERDEYGCVLRGGYSIHPYMNE